MEGLGTWAPPFSLNRSGGRDRFSLTYIPDCRLHGGAPAGLAEAEGRNTASAIPSLQAGNPDPDPAHPERGSGGLQRDEDLPQGMALRRGYGPAWEGGHIELGAPPKGKEMGRFQ